MKRNLAGDALAGASIYTPKMAGSRGDPLVVLLEDGGWGRNLFARNEEVSSPGFHFMNRFVSLRVVAASPTAIIPVK